MRSQLLHIILFFIATNVLAQKPIVLLEVDPKEAEIGEILTITIKSNIEGEIDIDFPSGFVHGYNIMNGMKQEIDYNTGKVISYYYLSQTGAMPKAGTFKIGPAYIKKGNKVYRSNTVNITIKKENVTSGSEDDLSAKQLRQPAFGIIEKSKSTIYEGESVVLNAKVYAQFDASHLEGYQEYSLDGVIDKHEIGNTSRIVVEEEKIKRRTYYTFQYDKKVVFPNGTGKMTVEPFKLILRRGFESLPLTSAGTTIEVKPLPGNVPKDFIGGVGQFSISRTIEKGSFKQGDVFTMTIEIKGYGNLQNILEPKLVLPRGFIIYGDPVIKEDFTFGSRGAEGKISYEYNIQVTKDGEITLPASTISYFDPVKEKYVQITTESNLLAIEKNEKFKSTLTDSTSIVQKSVEDEMMIYRADHGNKSPHLIYNKPIFWIALSSPVMIALLFGFWLRKKEEDKIAGAHHHTRRQAQHEIQHLFTEADHAFAQNEFHNYYNLIEKAVQRSLSLFLKNDDSIILSKGEIFDQLKLKKMEESKIQELNDLFTKCEHARYGMGINPDERENIVPVAKKVVQSITHV